MQLYSQFAKYYDLIFPAKLETVQFLTQHFSQGHILDMACGSGEYSIALAKEGFFVTGMDIDPEMIAYATVKSKDSHQKVDFEEIGMLEFIPRKQYDGIFCIGNSIVHLENLEYIKKTLEMFYKALKKQGKMILQIINYDVIPTNSISKLPSIENQGVTFHRTYVPIDDKRLEFQTSLQTPDAVFKNSAILYRLSAKDLLPLLKEVGFKVETTYGDFAKSPFVPTKSYHLIIVSQK